MKDSMRRRRRQLRRKWIWQKRKHFNNNRRKGKRRRNIWVLRQLTKSCIKLGGAFKDSILELSRWLVVVIPIIIGITLKICVPFARDSRMWISPAFMIIGNDENFNLTSYTIYIEVESLTSAESNNVVVVVVREHNKLICLVVLWSQRNYSTISASFRLLEPSLSLE